MTDCSEAKHEDALRAELARVTAERDRLHALVDELEADGIRVRERAERAEADAARLRDALRGLLDSTDQEDGSAWCDWPKRLTEDQREALCSAWMGEPKGSRWTT